MNTETATCPAGFSAELLAAYYDGLLDTVRTEAIHVHLAGCAICGARLEDHARVDAALRSQHVPEPSAQLWTDVRLAAIRPGRPSRSARRPARMLSGFGALVAVLLIALAFAQVLRDHAGNERRAAAAATSTATAARLVNPLVSLTPAPPALPPVAGSAVRFSPVAAPFSLTEADAGGIAVSPSDGNTAYLCYGHNTYHHGDVMLWGSHDSGATWTPMAPLPESGNEDIAACQVWTDVYRPNVVAALVSAEDNSTATPFVHVYLSRDGGIHWTRLSDTLALTGLATVSTRSYALRATGTDRSTFSGQHLSVSTDDLVTWQPIDQQFTSRQLTITQFWLRPGDGALLAAVSPYVQPNTPPPAQTLWQSTDGGAHWTRVPAPAMRDFTVRPAASGQPWSICGDSYDSTNAQNPNLLACTSDGGTTWTARPALRLMSACTGSSCAAPIMTQAAMGSSLAPDGAVLALGPYGPLKNGVIQQIQGIGLYRLPAGSSQWQYLGPLPGNAYFIAPTARGGALWSFGGGVHPGTLSGTLGQTSYGSGIFAADYQP